MRCVLGFDGGGTKTECVLIDESGAIAARSRSGAANPFRVGIDAALKSLIDAAQQALSTAGRSSADVVGICAGIAGAGRAELSAEITRRLNVQFPSANISIYTDLGMALVATGEIPSVVVIAGTGSASIGRDASGNLARDGGFGPILGDPGSAYDIGRKAVVEALRHHMDGQNSYLGNEILQYLHCDWPDLQDRIRAQPDIILPGIFSLVVKAASAGDESIRALLRAAAQDLCQLASHVINKLYLREQEFFLARVGGVFGHSALLDDTFEKLVHAIAPRARIGPLPRSIAETAARAAFVSIDHSAKQPEG